MKNINKLLLLGSLFTLPIKGMERPPVNRHIAFLQIACQSIDPIDHSLSHRGTALITLWEEFWRKYPAAQKMDLQNEDLFYDLFKNNTRYANTLRAYICNTLISQSTLLTAIRDQQGYWAIIKAKHTHAEKVEELLHFENEIFYKHTTFGSLFSENQYRIHTDLVELTSSFLLEAYTQTFLKNLANFSKDELDRNNKIIFHHLCVLSPSRNQNPADWLKKTISAVREELAKQPAPLAAKTS